MYIQCLHHTRGDKKPTTAVKNMLDSKQNGRKSMQQNQLFAFFVLFHTFFVTTWHLRYTLCNPAANSCVGDLGVILVAANATWSLQQTHGAHYTSLVSSFLSNTIWIFLFFIFFTEPTGADSSDITWGYSSNFPQLYTFFFLSHVK